MAVETIRGFWSPGRGGVVAVFKVRASFVHGGQTRAERCSRLRHLSCSLLLSSAFEELLEADVVFAGLGQQRGRVLVGKQARLGDSGVSNSHERFSTQVETYVAGVQGSPGRFPCAIAAKGVAGR